ncbi:MAG TPA: Uma2 family endonuclease [Bryobacteraceae bacterium]|nr:Uma2 family endonuclease [Bryobacteraceae bacterium]
MAIKTLLSIQEFGRLPDDDMQHELDEGELIAIPPAKSSHNTILVRLLRILQSFEQRIAGEARPEAGFLLVKNPPTIRQPDVAFVLQPQLDEAQEDEYFQGAPALAVEVVSRSDDFRTLDRKVEQYLAAGARLVWIVMPEDHRIRIYRGDGTSSVLHETDSLDAPELLPGWSMPVSRIFAKFP